MGTRYKKVRKPRFGWLVWQVLDGEPVEGSGFDVRSLDDALTYYERMAEAGWTVGLCLELSYYFSTRVDDYDHTLEAFPGPDGRLPATFPCGTPIPARFRDVLLPVGWSD